MQALSSYVVYAETCLSQKFKQEMGITVTEYIMRQNRAGKAASLGG